MSSFTWIRTEKRHRIYARDDYRCVWCFYRVTPVKSVAGSCTPRAAHLDHVVPRSVGGSNHHSNLVTACHHCNSIRGDKSAESFAYDLAAGARTRTEDRFEYMALILARVCYAMGRELPPKADPRPCRYSSLESLQRKGVR